MMSTETGKPIAQAAGEISDAADQFDWYAGETQRIYGQTIEARLPDVRSYVRYDPVGVVAAFSAWNFPALLPSRKIAAALAAGCAVIVKPAGEAAGSAMAIVQALHDANLPEHIKHTRTYPATHLAINGVEREAKEEKRKSTHKHTLCNQRCRKSGERKKKKERKINTPCNQRWSSPPSVRTR